jgi:hypothetical protein
MRFLRPATHAETTIPLPRPEFGRWARLRFGAERLAARGATRPYRATLLVMGLNVVLGVAFVALGQLLFSDPAELFRELMPGTWLSFVELLFIAAVALLIQREVSGEARLRLDNLWGLSAAVFLVFAVDEITQATIFLADLLTAVGALAPAGFKDLDAFLLVVLFLAAGVAMLRYAGELLAHPPAAALLCVGLLLGAASQTLDSTLATTESEFVAEESLKLAAEAFIVGGFLLVLHRVRRGPHREPAPGVTKRV